MNNNFHVTKIERIIYVDENEYKNKTNRFSNKIQHNELICCFYGEDDILFDDTVYRCEGNHIRILPACNVKNYETTSISPSEVIVIYFDTDMPISEDMLIFKPKKSSKLNELFKKAFISWISKKDGYTFECMSLLYNILYELQKENTYISQSNQQKIQPAIDYINNKFLTENIKCEHLSRLCGVSYPYFKTLFIKTYNISPKKYIEQLIFDHACKLLYTGKYSVNEVSDMCGFNDIYYFSRHFKKHNNITPSEYIKKYKSSK